MNTQSDNDKARESKLRRDAKKQGYVLIKSRVRNQRHNNNGGYQIRDDMGRTEAGPDFELSLDDVEKILKKWSG